MSAESSQINTKSHDSIVLDKQWLQQQFEAMDTRNGFVLSPATSAESLRAQMLKGGMHPEDNILSREILRERYPDDVSEGV